MITYAAQKITQLAFQELIGSDAGNPTSFTDLAEKIQQLLDTLPTEAYTAKSLDLQQISSTQLFC